MTSVIVGLISAFAGGGLVTLINVFANRNLTKRKEKQTEAQTDEIVVKTLKSALVALNDDVVKPIQEESKNTRTELKKVTHELTKFRKAIEKIPACPHADTCPVSRELQLQGDKK